MRGLVWLALRTTGLVAFTATLAATPAWAQTTVVIDAPRTEVADTFIRSGSYASKNFDGDPLVTRDSDDDPSYLRRTLLKFDTENRVPRNARITSAILTLTLKDAGSGVRTIGAYRVTQSFDEWSATWKSRKKSSKWRSGGADLGAKYAQASVGDDAGSKVNIDLTDLVQEAVKGKFGSRYTRVALVDIGGTGSDGTSYREFHSSEASDPAVRPRLTVKYGAKATVEDEPEEDEDEEDDQSEDAEDPAEDYVPPRSSSSSTLRVLHWNTHHGRGSDNDYDLNRIATWIAKMNPDVVTLNEVERFVGAHGKEDQPKRYATLLKAKTGRTWYYHYLSSRGGSTGGGSAILSRFPITSEGECALSSTNNAVQASVVANGRTVNILVTHLPPGSSSSPRVKQTRELLSCARNFAESRIITGDWNATQQRTEYRDMLDDYQDAWSVAKGKKAAVDFPRNTRDGATHNYRIDYVFFSKKSRLSLVKAQVYDTRGSDGARASDHKPLMVTFSVK